MKRNHKTKTSHALLLGIAVGLLVAGYAFKNRGQHDDLMAFKAMFFPMLVTLGVAVLVQALLWYYVGRKLPDANGRSMSFREKSEIFLAECQGSWVGVLYRCLSAALAFGAGYVSVTPVTALFLL